VLTHFSVFSFSYDYYLVLPLKWLTTDLETGHNSRQVQWFLYYPPCPEVLWGPLGPLYNVYWNVILRGHTKVLQRLGFSGDLLLLLYILMTCCLDTGTYLHHYCYHRHHQYRHLRRHCCIL